jgi:hypothetical protein
VRESRALTGLAVIIGRVILGVALVAPLQLHWLTRGNGSTFSGLRLASTLLHHERVGPWGRLGGGAIFVVALLGALSIATAPVASRIVHILDVSLGAAIVGILVVLAVLGHPRISVWDAGFIVTGAGGLAATLVGTLAWKYGRAVSETGR